MSQRGVINSRRPKVASNSSVIGVQKRKNGTTQTTNSSFTENCVYFIPIDGKIAKDDQNNYKKAIDFVNKWNIAMNAYLKKKIANKKQNLKIKECFDPDGTSCFATIPNYMALFLTLQELDNRPLSSKKPVKKNSFTQTQNLHEQIVVVDVKSQTQYVRFCDQTTESTDIENIPKEIQQGQYGAYPEKNLRASPRIIEKPFQCPPLKQSARFSDSSIEQTSFRQVRREVLERIPSANKDDTRKMLKQNQSFGSFSVASSARGQFRRAPFGFLSPNGMIASEINANGTPLVVRDMFEKVQKPVDRFVSHGNILNNISRNESSSSSVILTDKESLEFEDVKNDLERISSPYAYVGRAGGQCLGSNEEVHSVKHHPLNLNERDLNSKERSLISSIGIFTEAGTLKPNAKNYLETKEDVKRGTFRAPRLTRFHVTNNYNFNSCTSESLLSDALSNRSSDYDD